MPNLNRLERRAALLGQKMRDTTDALAHQLGAGERPAFTTALPKSASLAWWRQHLYDEYGQKVLATMEPDQIVQLHLDLQTAMNAERGVAVNTGEVA